MRKRPPPRPLALHTKYVHTAFVVAGRQYFSNSNETNFKYLKKTVYSSGDMNNILLIFITTGKVMNNNKGLGTRFSDYNLNICTRPECFVTTLKLTLRSLSCCTWHDTEHFKEYFTAKRHLNSYSCKFYEFGILKMYDFYWVTMYIRASIAHTYVILLVKFLQIDLYIIH